MSKEVPGILNIGVDVDGVVASIYKEINQLVKENLRVDIEAIRKAQGQTDYWLHCWPQVTTVSGGSEFVRSLWDNPNVFRKAEKVPGAVRTLNQWRKQNYQIWFITSRNEKSVGLATERWFEENGLGWAVNEGRILFISPQDKDRPSFKSAAAKRLGLHVFIEDHDETLAGIEGPTMMIKILIACHHNSLEKAGRQVRRVKDWKAIKRLAEETSQWHYFIMSHNIDTELVEV